MPQERDSIKFGNLVLLHREGEVAKLLLNRPGRHNSLIPQSLEEMIASLRFIQSDPQIRVIFLSSVGSSFSTGGDIKGFYDHLNDLESYANEIVGLLNQVILEMLLIPVPIVTAVHGIVTGGAIGFVLASDIVLVTPQASFTPYYSVVGFSPDGGWTAILPRIIGSKRVVETLMTNRTITAEESVSWGMATRLVSQDNIWIETEKIIQQLISMKSGSLECAKSLLRNSYGDIESMLESERQKFVTQVVSTEAKQGMAVFLGIDDLG